MCMHGRCGMHMSTVQVQSLWPLMSVSQVFLVRMCKYTMLPK